MANTYTDEQGLTFDKDTGELMVDVVKSQPDITNVEVDKDTLDMTNLALDNVTKFLATYKNPKDWVLDEKEARLARMLKSAEPEKSSAVGSLGYSAGELLRTTYALPRKVISAGAMFRAGLEDVFFPNAEQSALERWADNYGKIDAQRDRTREELVAQEVGYQDWYNVGTAAMAMARDLALTGGFAKLGAYVAGKRAVNKLADRYVGKEVASRYIGKTTAKGAEKAGGATIAGSVFAQELGEGTTQDINEYIAKTGDYDLKYYEPGVDFAVNVGVGALSAIIEKGLGVERFVPRLIARGYGDKIPGLMQVLARGGEGLIGEAAEEGLQDTIGQFGEMIKGYRDWWDFDWDRILTSMTIGGALGGAAGSGLYYINRRVAISKLTALGVDKNTAADLVDTMASREINKTLNNLSAVTELQTHSGQAYDKLKAGIKSALELQGWSERVIDSKTGEPMDIDEYVDALARNFVITPAIKEAYMSGLSIDTFLDIAQFGVFNNVLALKPLGSLQEIQAKIDQQNAIIKRQQELKKTGAGNDTLLKEARIKKAVLQQAYTHKKLNQEIQKVNIEESKTPEITKEIDNATKDVETLKNTSTQADFNSGLSDNLTTNEKVKRFGNAVIKRIFGKDKTGFDAVMTLPQYTNAKLGIINSANRIFEFAKAHRTYGINTDLRNALKRLEITTKDNFVESVTVPNLEGNDVIAENAFLYHFLFSDSNTISAYIDAYLERAEASISSKTGTSLSKKDLVGQAFKATDNLMQVQAESAGIEYTSIYNEDGSLADVNVGAVFASYQNQFIADTQTTGIEFQEQFDLADENARLDDIYPEYTGETIRIIDPAELKQAQYEVIQRTNPMQDDYHVGIRSVEDIKTFDETINDKDSFVWGDYSQEDAKRDLAKNEITIYSSKPIENGVFVSTSYRQAQEYAGGKGAKVYEKTVPLDYVAWINGDEGQFAITDVIGKKRTVYNSNGERIAQSEPALRNFYKWFGDSKVVDEEGRPIVMYHGTSNTFDSFDPTTFGYATDSGFFGSGFYFTPIESEARYYGRIVMPVYLKIEKPFIVSTGGYYSGLYDNLFEGGGQLLKDLGLLAENDLKNFNKYERLKKEFLKNAKVEKIYTYDAKHNEVQVWRASFEKNGRSYESNSYRPWEEVGYNEKADTKENALNNAWGEYAHFNDLNFLIQDLSFTDYIRTNGLAEELSNIIKARGYDGTIAGDEHIVFEPNQIKSVDNRGTFSEKTGNINYQGKQANGFYDPELDLIVLGKNFNTMTLPHEFAHYWLNTLFNVYKRVQSGDLKVKPEWVSHVKELFNMVGIVDTQENLTRGQQEKFARMTESYLTGIGVSKEMNQTFTEYFKWGSQKYKSILQLGYLDDQGKIQYPFLDQKAVDFFNRWYENASLPSLPTSPERQRFMNVTGDDNKIQQVSIKEMNDREKEFAQDAEEQNKTDARLYTTLDENMPNNIKPTADAQKVVINERSNFLKESKAQQVQVAEEPKRRWFERKSRATETQIAQEYIEQNPEHAKEVIFGDPEFVPNNTGIDRSTLINTYMAMNNITPEHEDWARLHTNIAINQSLAGTQLALSNDKSYGTYLDALREIENVLEMKAATNYAGSKVGAVERFNTDIQRFLDKELPAIFATEPNSKERETALQMLFEKARTTFSGNTTGTFLNQVDLDYAKAQRTKNEVFMRWATNQIKKDAGAKLNNEQQAKLLQISAKAQQALVDIDNQAPAKAIAAAQELRNWQLEKQKMMGVSPQKFSLFGDYAPRAMLASFNTLVVANIPSTAINTAVVNMVKTGLFGKNKVSKNLIDAEISRIKAIYGATAMNLAQMEKPTSPSLLHGEKYSAAGQKWYDPYTILGKEDNFFRVPTFVNTLAQIASTDAKATGRNADEVFKQYIALNNQTDEAKLARKQALAVANMAVFTQNGALANCLNHIRSELNKVSRLVLGLEPKGFGLGNLLSPFLTTGANIAEMGIRGSIAPITTISSLVNSWRTGKAIDPLKKLALRMDWTYFTISAVSMVLLAALTSDDDDFYTDPYMTGRKYSPDKPYDSINLGGIWLDLDFFGPFSIPMRTAAKVIQAWKTDNGIGESIAKGYLESGKTVFGDVPLVESIVNNQFNWAVKKPGAWATSYLYTQANKLIPAQIKPVSRAISRGAGVEFDVSDTTLGRKFNRNYGFDGAELTTQDLVELFTIKLQLDESVNKTIAN